MTDEELRMAVKAQQQFLAKLAEVAKGKEETLAVQARTVEVVREDTALLRDQKSKLELLRVMAAHQSGQQNCELQAKQIDTSKEILKMACDSAREYSQDHKGDPYVAAGVKHIFQSAARIAESTSLRPKETKSSKGFSESQYKNLDERANKAVQQGLRWNSNNTRPGKPSTILKKVEAWEKSYSEGMTTPDLDIFLSKTYQDLEGTKGKSFIIGICERLEGLLNLEQASTYLPTRFRGVVEAYGGRIVTVKVLEPKTNTPEDFAESLSEEIYGHIDSDVVNILVDRISRHGGVHKLTPELIRKTCTVKRLPTFIEWDSSHVTDMERFSALREGFYDHLYERFVRED
jgi:hypothetical protein